MKSVYVVMFFVAFFFVASCSPDMEVVADESDLVSDRGDDREQSFVGGGEPISISAVAQCGSACPSGQHAVARSCTRTCNGGLTCTSSSSLNTVYCEANTSSFSQCGTSCPSGWHSTSKYCNSSCQNGLACQYFIMNAAQCVANSGTFNQCGTTCPSGWVATSVYCNAQCQNGLVCTSSSPSNAASCRPL